MPRIPVTQWDLLEAVRQYLEDDLSLDPRQCYLTVDLYDEPPTLPMGGDFWIAVALGDGQFDQAIMEGAVREQCVEETHVDIGGYSRVHLDDVGRDGQLLGESARGLMRLKRTILNSLAGVDITPGTLFESSSSQSSGEVVTVGDPVLWELLKPVYASKPQKLQTSGATGGDAGIPVGMVSVTFLTRFAWDLD